ncbi:MAG: hypothetical protein KF760_22515 [Candidatus Eremiobacteraeota bacterium]|nr:hypothetical protein [Candidatus Eremiobacteraeota bacterium]MCW5868594.1 hypothetical protein [Candidatus Eremiobacteraeota bacterium]
MRTRLILGFLVGAFFSWQLSPIFYEWVLIHSPDPWAWLLGLPALGYWVGQAPRIPFRRGLVCGWIAPPLLVWLPEIQCISHTLATWGGCGTGRRFAWMQATGLLFCLPAALGQLRCYLRKSTQSRLPQ